MSEDNKKNTHIDQRGQQVGTQVNIGGDAHIGHVGDQVYNTNLALIASQDQIKYFFAQAMQADAQGAAELLQLLLSENSRDQEGALFEREEITDDSPPTLDPRFQPAPASQEEPRFKTHLPFLPNGTRFLNRFSIKGFVGRGGFADAYIAWDMVYDREAVLKRLRSISEQEAYLNRFINREKLIAARLRTDQIPGIVHTYDVISTAGEVCLVQEHIPGKSLHERLLMLTVINPREAITTTIKLCEALQTLHDRGIVHCDVKPLNIIIRSPGDPVLIDLGMARFIGEKFPEEEIVVSPLYSAPELYTATKVDGRVDVYSLGITLLHMLTGLPRIENLVLGENVVTRDDGYQERIYDTMAGPELRFLDLPSKEILQKHTEAGLNQVHPLLLQIILEEAIAPADQRIATAELFGRRLQNFLA